MKNPLLLPGKGCERRSLSSRKAAKTCECTVSHSYIFKCFCSRKVCQRHFWHILERKRGPAATICSIIRPSPVVTGRINISQVFIFYACPTACKIFTPTRCHFVVQNFATYIYGGKMPTELKMKPCTHKNGKNEKIFCLLHGAQQQTFFPLHASIRHR